MGKSVKRNFIYNTIFQIILLIIPLITTPYVSRVLGPENVGRHSFATAIVTYFVIVCTLGSTVLGQRNIAYYRDDKAKMSEVFWNIVFFRIISVTISIIIYFLYMITSNSMTPLTIIVGLNLINVLVDITWFYQGIEEFKKTIVRSVVIKLVSLLLIFIFVNDKNDTPVYAFIFSGSMVIGNIVLWLPLKKYINRPYHIHPFNDIRGMIVVFLPTIASQVYTVLDKSMIGWITGSEYENGCYEQSERLARAALTIITAVSAVIMPRVANLYNNGDLEKARYYICKGYRVVWTLGFPIMFGTISLSSFFIPVYLGLGFDLSVVLLQIFSFLILFVSLAHITGISYLIPTGQQNVYTVSVLIAAVVNFFMNLGMIPHYGAIGAAIASISAEFVGVLIQISFCITKKQISFGSIFLTSKNYLIASTVMFLLLLLLKNLFSICIISLMLLSIIGFFSYVIMLLLLKDEMIISISSSFLYHIKKSKFLSKNSK